MNAPASNLTQRLDEAEALHQQGRLAEAESLFQAVLEGDAGNFSALNRMGVIRAKQGRHEEALVFLRAALEQEAQSATVHYNVGIVLAALGRRDEAMASYRRAIAIQPDFAQAHVNLGNLLDAARQTEAAIASYRRAVEIKPDLAAAYENLGETLLSSRQPVEAAEVFRQWLDVDPDNRVATYLYALASGKDVAPRAPDAWVERHFDKFAPTFDADLHKLGYRGPRLVADALARACGPPRGRLAALDAGCGTGLCGPLVRPYASRLTGVDLSSGMLERAKATGSYDELYHGELVAYMRTVVDAFELVVASDTLIYFGALESALAAAHGALRTGGLLIFTVEEARDRDARKGYRLNNHGRYSHSHRYLRRVLPDAGFGVLAIESAMLRTEARKPVRGFVTVCEKMAHPGMRAPLATRLRALRMSLWRAARWIRRRGA